MDVVDSYEQDFIRKAAQLRQKLSIIGGLQGEKKKAAIQEAERLYDDTKRTLFNLEQAARSTGNRKYETKVRSCTTELQKLQRDLEHASLISSSYSPKEETYADWQTEQRQRLLVSNSRVDSTGESLVNAHRIAEETVNIGTNVLSELGSQRQQLERARDNLVQIDDNMGRSRKILSVMSRRIATNKMILAFIIVILFAAICFVAYFKWIRKLI